MPHERYGRNPRCMRWGGRQHIPARDQHLHRGQALAAAGALATLVRDELGLDLVQHSLDLVDLDAPPDEVAGQAEQVRAACAAAGLTLHSTFTGLAAYSSNLLLHPDPAARERARAWYRRAIDFTPRPAPARPAATSARTGSTAGATRQPGGSCGPSSPSRSRGSPPTPATAVFPR